MYIGTRETLYKHFKIESAGVETIRLKKGHRNATACFLAEAELNEMKPAAVCLFVQFALRTLARGSFECVMEGESFLSCWL